LKFVESP
jgi:hypothetical protein